MSFPPRPGGRSDSYESYEPYEDYSYSSAYPSWDYSEEYERDTYRDVEGSDSYNYWGAPPRRVERLSDIGINDATLRRQDLNSYDAYDSYSPHVSADPYVSDVFSGSYSPPRERGQFIRVWYRPMLAMLAVIVFLAAYDLITGYTSHEEELAVSRTETQALDSESPIPSEERTQEKEIPEENPIHDTAAPAPEKAEKGNEGLIPQEQDLPIPPKALKPQDIGALPEGGAVTYAGTGQYRTIPGPNQKHGEGRQRVITYIVQVEEGINPAEYGGDQFFADTVISTLADKRSWIGDPSLAFQQIDEGVGVEPDLRIQLSAVETTHEICGQSLKLETSCYYRIGNRVVLNEARWVRGAAGFSQNLEVYRQYMINHEVGHGIGNSSHVPCTGQGDKAPIMMQQTISLNNQELYSVDPSEVYANQDISCRPNAWAYPDS